MIIDAIRRDSENISLASLDAMLENWPDKRQRLKWRIDDAKRKIDEDFATANKEHPELEGKG